LDPSAFLRCPLRVEIFIATLGIAGAAAWFGLGDQQPYSSLLEFPVAWWCVVAVFFAAEGWAVHVHFRRESHSISLNEIALVPGLLFLGSHELIAAHLLGAGAALVIVRRQRPTKLLFNLAGFVATTSAAIAIFHALVQSASLSEPRLWAAVVAACLASSLIGVALVTGIILIAEGSWSPATVLRTSITSLCSTLTTTSLALAMVLVVDEDFVGIVLFAFPAVGALLLLRAYIGQTRRHEHLSFLYDSMAATQNAPDFGLALTQLIGALRTLVRADHAEIILLADPERGLQSISRPGADTLMQPFPVDDDLRENLERVRAGGSVLIPRGSDPGSFSSFMRERGLADAIVAPLMDSERLFGLMVAGNRSGDVATFTRDDQALAMTFANHASVLLENGRLEKTLADITELQEKLRHLAFHDDLTGLPNRTAFLELVSEALDDAAHRAPPAVLFLDLDNFKSINDTYGHATGNHVLVEVSDRLQRVAGETVTTARLGGDEFAVLVLSSEEGRAEQIAAEIEELFVPSVTDGTNVFAVAPSIGVAVATAGMTTEELLRNADIAMYAAKAAGRGCTRSFVESMLDRIRSEHGLEQELRVALAESQLFTVFQPIVSLQTGQIAGFEALVRWAHPSRGVLLPADFLPLATEAGLLPAIDSQVLWEACAALSAWRTELADHGDVKMNVNISADHLAGDGVVELIERTIAESGLENQAITFEITETSMMHNADASIRATLELVERGLGLSIDDFGTGHSSLERLEQFPLQSLKIAKPFVDRLTGREAGQAFVGAMLEIARAVGAVSIAEGIETEAQAAELRRLGCEFGQGFFFAAPLLRDEARAMLASCARLPRAA
jgi:diguanylate cyclase (GGDEF)-like protein